MLVVVVGRARALGRDHQRTDWLFWSAFAAKEFALRGLEHAFQYLAALRRFRIGDAHAWDRKSLLGIPLRIARANLQRGLRDESQPAPFEIGAKFEHFRH